MLSLAELERVIPVLAWTVVGSRLQAVVQPDERRVVLTLYGAAHGEKAQRCHLLLCADPEGARVSLLAKPPASPGAPRAFAQYLRAHALSGRVAAVRQQDGDRQLVLDLRRAEGDLRILLSIFGRRSNVYVLDGEDRILAALRPLAETRNELRLKQPWRSPSSPPRRKGEDRFAATGDAALLAEIEHRYAARERQDAEAALARSLRHALEREAKTRDRKLEKLRRELAEAEESLACERKGELLKSALGLVGPGDRAIVVRDWQSGEDVTVPLDPALSPAENLERLFARYRKAVRTLTKGGAQLAAVEASREELAGLERALADAGDDADALRSLAERPEIRRLLGKQARKAPPERRESSREWRVAGRVVPPRLVPRRYRTESGLEIWVGRSDAANDFLSTRLARGKDLFFHLDGAPGSHVVLRTEGRDDPPSEAVLDACELAVHFSKAKKASRADVHVVPIRNVRKPKGAKPGLVTVHGGRSIHLRRSEARLTRILAARIENGEDAGH